MLNPVMNTYNRYPLTLKEGKGSYVYDDQGHRYLDFTSGIATCNLGHIPPQVEDSVKKQLATLWHCSNLFTIPSQQALAEKLVDHSCFDQVFFCNSGAEANETAIKIARKYARQKLGKSQGTIVTFRQSFHGRTMATITATGQDKVQAGFAPLLPGFRYANFNCSEALPEIARSDTIAVLVELIQGEGGVIPAEIQWIKDIAASCHKHRALLMIDEVQTGIGRTGSLFAYEQYGIEPDVISLAKGLGSGFPIGALLAKEEVAEVLSPGSHGSTFGGNPLATTAGLATINQIVAEGFLDSVKQKSSYFWQQLTNLQKHYSQQISEVRGLGLLIGLHMPNLTAKVIESARQQGLLLLPAGSEVVRILPPLTVTSEQLDDGIAILEKVMATL